MHLYKYIAVDKKLSNSPSERKKLESIAQGIVKFSFLSALNDPAESLFRFKSHNDDEFRLHILRSSQGLKSLGKEQKLLIKLWLNDDQALIYSDIIQFLLSIGMSKTQVNTLESTFPITSPTSEFKMRRDSYGVFCVSARDGSSIMWSHYCRSHTGICIEYEVGEILPHKVQYSHLRPLPLGGDIISNANQLDSEITRVLTTKLQDWSYENEWRLIRKQSHTQDEKIKGGFLSQIDWKIRSIIFGMHTPPSNIREIKSIFSHSTIYFQCKHGFNDYNIYHVS